MKKPPLCNFHKRGVPPDVRADSYFKPGCPKCEDKLARGVVTGNEPPPFAVSRYSPIRYGAAT